MKTSILLTLNNRSEDVIKAVSGSLSLPGNAEAASEVIVVLDRPEPDTKAAALRFYDLVEGCRFVEIEGERGWSSPVPGWNRAIAESTGDLLYCFSSDVVQAQMNVVRASRLAADLKTVVHGRCECSCGPQGTEVNWNGTAPGNLFGDAAHPRPMGFIWCGPAKQVKSIGGYDPEFSKGLWYDDNDFFLRLWRTGVDFLFHDSISGIHLHHPRPDLESPEGQRKIALNHALMLRKHATLNPWPNLQRMTTHYDSGSGSPPLLIVDPLFQQHNPAATRWSHL